MTDKTKRQGGDIFIVDNSDNDWKAVDYLREWTSIANQFDIATGYFEIGALLALEGQWQQLEKIRILMGDEVTKRTKQALLDGIQKATTALNESLEREKESNDFLKGVPAIVEALRSRKIDCRVYAKKKFHAKAYITHSKLTVVGSSALVGTYSLVALWYGRLYINGASSALLVLLAFGATAGGEFVREGVRKPFTTTRS